MENNYKKYIEIKVMKLKPGAIVPTYATQGSGGFDFYSTEYGQISYGNPLIVNTGIAVAIPEDYSLLILSRSGHGFKENVRLSNSVGLIDSDYRGEIKIKLTMDFPSWMKSFEINPGDRIAQGFVVYTPKISFNIVDSLPVTDRGTGGFGSTG